jgi:hypothetical protein
MKNKMVDEVGKCFKCGGDFLTYGETDIDGDSLSYKYVCEKCGHQGYEIYKLEWCQQQ